MPAQIIKGNISDYFPIVSILAAATKIKITKKQKKTKRDFSNKNIQNFQFLLEINKMGPNFALKYT